MITIPAPLTISALTHLLTQRYDDRVLSQQYALWIMQAITQQSAVQLLTTADVPITQQQRTTLQSWLDALIIEHKPLQYLLGWVPFGQLTILVEPPMLIPRPETEQWCLQLIEALKRCSYSPRTILDLCTGSGCIALTLAHAYKNATITGVDINPQALKLAEKNSEHNGITNVRWVASDLFDSLDRSQRFDLIVANPPYIAHSEWQELDRSVRDWEDTRALVAEDEGLALIKRICMQARSYLQPSAELAACGVGQLWMEIGHRQGAAVSEIFTHAGFTHVTIIHDLEGKERVVVGAVPRETTD